MACQKQAPARIPGGTGRCDRLARSVGLGLLGLALMACGALEVVAPPGTRVAPGRIAYVETHGDLVTVRPDGSALRRLTDRGGPEGTDERSMHSWPTWSPDARRVAATRVDLGVRPSVGVYIYPADGGESTPVMITPEASPFFAAWSPDGRALAILAREPDGVGLHVRRADGLGGRRLAVGEPLYLAWRPDGRALVAHIDGDAGDVPTARVLVLPVDGAAPSRLLTAPSAFRAPAVGRLTTVVGGVDAAGQHTILAVDAAGTARPLATGGWSPAFALSPRGDRLALGREVAGARGVLDAVEVIDLETGAVERWHNGPVVAFFWSPDGARLAWAGVDWSAVELEWRVASRPGDAHRIAALRPSEQFAATLAFFDQYAATTGVWSPDGRALVVSGWTGGLVDGPSRVWVLDAAGASPPRSLAEGVMASWSPR